MLPFEAEPDAPLLGALREQVALIGTKYGGSLESGRIPTKEETMKITNRIKRAAVLAGGLAMTLPAAAQQVTMMTGPQGGSWIPLGGALKSMWEQAVPGLQIQQTPGAGIANVRGIDEGKAQIGFANSSTTVDGIEGRAPDRKSVV